LRASDHSAHEWLRRQHVLGNVEGAQSFHRAINAAREEPSGFLRSVITQTLEASRVATLRLSMQMMLYAARLASSGLRITSA
jgi:hypothetical protein